MSQVRHLFRVVVVGDSGVGKSNILMQFTSQTHDPDSRSTIGVDSANRTVTVNGVNVRLQVWDAAGQERYRGAAQKYYRGANGALVVFDITSRDSFTHVTSWLDEIKRYGSKEVVIVLVGNKNDLESEREVTQEEAAKFAVEHGMLFAETSALDTSKVNKAFETCVSEIYRRQKKAESDSEDDEDKREREARRNERRQRLSGAKGPRGMATKEPAPEAPAPAPVAAPEPAPAPAPEPAAPAAEEESSSDSDDEELAERTKALEAVTAERDQLLEQLSGTQQQLLRATKELADAVLSRPVEQETVMAITRERDEARQMISVLTRELDDTQKEVKLLRERLRKETVPGGRAELNSLREKITSIRGELVDVTRERDDAWKEVNDLKARLNDATAARHEPPATKPAALGKISTFGTNLDEVLRRDGTDVPVLMSAVMEYLQQDDRLDSVGIFRVSGMTSQVRALREAFDSGKRVDLADKCHDPHAAASLMKLFFRSLPEPLLTAAMYDKFMGLAEPGGVNQAKAIDLLKRLPAANRTVFATLIRFLAEVIKHDNKMHASNLAVVWGPNVLYKPGMSPMEEAMDLSKSQQVLGFMIENADTIADAISRRR